MFRGWKRFKFGSRRENAADYEETHENSAFNSPFCLKFICLLIFCVENFCLIKTTSENLIKTHKAFLQLIFVFFEFSQKKSAKFSRFSASLKKNDH